MSRHGKKSKTRFDSVEKLRLKHGERRVRSGKRIRKSSHITQEALQHLLDQETQLPQFSLD